jgi:enoyl-CoA hydratase/carnithine racemase
MTETANTDAHAPAGPGVVWSGRHVRIELDADRPKVATVRIDRPKLNPLNALVQRELGEAAILVTERDDIRAAVLYGGEVAFAAGADIKEMADLSYTDMVKHSAVLQNMFSAVARIPKPVIAAVTGFALGGGCELSLCADLRVAADNAKFGQPEIKLGLIPGAGGTQRLARLVGPARAKELIFTGRTVGAEEALRIGLVDRVVPAAETYATALALAAELANGPAYALRAAKTAIDRGLETDLDTGLEIERQQFAALFATEDRAIGMRSFIEEGPGKAVFL